MGICDGKTSCGCTWTQLDGTRGVSYFRFNSDWQVSFAREVPEPARLAKAQVNTIQSLEPMFGLMGGIAKLFSFLPDILVVEDDKDREKRKPSTGIAAPKTRRARDVVTYLWEEAQFYEGQEGVNRTLAEYADNTVFEDLTVLDEAWPQGKEAIKKYQETSQKSAPDSLKFVLDEFSDGDQACALIWHVEVFGQKTPRGISFYELDDEGKVAYVRQSYNVTF